MINRIVPIVLGNCLQKDARLAVNQSQVRNEKPKKKLVYFLLQDVNKKLTNYKQ